MFFHSLVSVVPPLQRAACAALAALGLMAGMACLAQDAAPDAPTEPRQATVADRHSQRIETIRHEDAGSRVDELRSGGETQRITVQPKAAVPAYEVQPAGAHNREAGPGAAGRRVWKIPF